MDKYKQELKEVTDKFNTIDSALRSDLKIIYKEGVEVAYEQGLAKNAYFKSLIHTIAANVNNTDLTNVEFRQFVCNCVTEYIPPDKYIGKIFTVCNIHDGYGYTDNDMKYIGRAFGKFVKIVEHYKGSLYVTDFFLGNDILNNDYCKNGFLIVSTDNIK